MKRESIGESPVTLPPGWAWGRSPLTHSPPEIAIERVAGGRRVLHIPGRSWAYEPEECLDDTQSGEWVLNGRVLVCPGCGLDCT